MIVKCINCGLLQALQNGENFACNACGWKWTIEDEAKQAQYIRTILRRQPITAVVTPTSAAVTTASAATPSLVDMTISELRALAANNDIDLSGLNVKQDIIEAIQAAS